MMIMIMKPSPTPPQTPHLVVAIITNDTKSTININDMNDNMFMTTIVIIIIIKPSLAPVRPRLHADRQEEAPSLG